MTPASRSTPRRVRRRPFVALVLLGVLVGLFFGVWRALRYEPEFYRQALARPAYREAAASEELERRVESWSERLRTEERWEQELTDEELNAWLAVELPRRFPGLLPAGLSEPRLVVDEGRVRCAARYEASGVASVVSIEAEVFVADSPNEIGVRVLRARAGAVPVPLSAWLDEAAPAAARSGMPVRVESRDGRPIVLVAAPSESPAWPDRRLVLEEVRTHAGRIVLSGRSEKRDAVGDRR